MKTKLKKRCDFYGSARYILDRGGNEADVLEKAQEFEISSKEVKEWFVKEAKKEMISAAKSAGEKEIYNTLDQEFIKKYPNLVVFRRGENVFFYEYINGVYILVTDQDMYNLVDHLMLDMKLLECRTSSHRVKDTIARIGSILSKITKRHFTDEEIQYQKWYLNLKNGLLDMNTFELLPHTSDYFSTIQVAHEYDTKAECPLFDKFIETVTGEDKDTSIMIKQMYGYSIMGGNPLHKVFYLFGDTARNGKSTCAKILCGLIGWGNVSTLTLQQIASENSSILTSIIGKQINFSDEISSKFIESSRLTAMSAEGVVEINPKFKPSFLYPVKSKFIIACNDLPRFNDYQGMKHRMISIPFRYHLKEGERISNYDQILLEKEGAGILNWAIEGAKMLKESHIFLISKDSEEDLKDNREQSAPVYTYLERVFCFSNEYTQEFNVEELYGMLATKDNSPTGYRFFCQQNGTNVCSSFTFARELKRFYRETEKIKQIRVGEKRERKYIGLKRMKDVEDDEALELF